MLRRVLQGLKITVSLRLQKKKTPNLTKLLYNLIKISKSQNRKTLKHTETLWEISCFIYTVKIN